MFNRILSFRSLLLALFCLVLVAGTTGCDSGSNEEDEVEFEVSAVSVPLQGGGTGIQFFATPSNDVELISVSIKPPVGDTESINAEGELFIKDESFGLQADGIAWPRISGTWTFTFRGNFSTGSQESFTRTETVNVGA